MHSTCVYNNGELTETYQIYISILRISSGTSNEELYLEQIRQRSSRTSTEITSLDCTQSPTFISQQCSTASPISTLATGTCWRACTLCKRNARISCFPVLFKFLFKEMCEQNCFISIKCNFWFIQYYDVLCNSQSSYIKTLRLEKYKTFFTLFMLQDYLAICIYYVPPWYNETIRGILLVSQVKFECYCTLSIICTVKIKILCL